MAFTTVNTGLLDPFTDTFIGMGRNRLINAGIDIDQANGGVAVTLNNATSGTYSVDMVRGRSNNGSAGAFTLQQLSATPPTGFNKYLRATTTAAVASPLSTDRFRFELPVEGYTIRDFNGAANFMLSFWARSSITGTFGVGISNATGVKTYIGQYTIGVANTWEYKTISITNTGAGTWGTFTSEELTLLFDLGSGSTKEGTANAWNVGADLCRASGNTRLISTNAATMDFTGFQFEIGSAATRFEVRPYPYELRLCQRYYEKSYGRDTNPGTNTAVRQTTVVTSQFGATSRLSQVINFYAEKRTSPTMILYPTDGSPTGSWTWMSTGGVQTERVTNVTSVGAYENGFGVAQTVTAADEIAFGHWVADSRM